MSRTTMKNVFFCLENRAVDPFVRRNSKDISKTNSESCLAAGWQVASLAAGGVSGWGGCSDDDVSLLGFKNRHRRLDLRRLLNKTSWLICGYLSLIS